MSVAQNELNKNAKNPQCYLNNKSIKINGENSMNAFKLLHFNLFKENSHPSIYFETNKIVENNKRKRRIQENWKSKLFMDKLKVKYPKLSKYFKIYDKNKIICDCGLIISYLHVKHIKEYIQRKFHIKLAKKRKYIFPISLKDTVESFFNQICVIDYYRKSKKYEYNLITNHTLLFLYQRFKSKHPKLRISYSYFCKSKPKNVKISQSIKFCVCSICNGKNINY